MDFKQGICPLCGSENLDYGVLQPDDDCIYYPCTCDDCGATFKEYYSLDFSGQEHISSGDTGDVVERYTLERQVREGFFADLSLYEKIATYETYDEAWEAYEKQTVTGDYAIVRANYKVEDNNLVEIPLTRKAETLVSHK